MVLLAAYLFLDSIDGNVSGNLSFLIMGLSYALAVYFSWNSVNGFWRKASATILILLPVGYVAVVLLFIIGMANF
ncbi:hypothetical protein BSG1_04770 [Bacillus sp. SG-1]|nr:hypothetical protein BSG1_04770 [Bacillus sp. SG-1]